MPRPEMILFDYGRTLAREPDFDLTAGFRALYPYIKSNPRSVTPEDWSELGERLFQEKFRSCRDRGLEIHFHRILRFELEYLGLTLTVSIPEAEAILWDAASAGERTPGVTELLSALAELGLRTGVVSNLMWSGAALERRLGRLLPDNHFEFVLASSEYIFRKPDPRIFELALRKAGLPPEAVWYCGDDLRKDVQGAHGAGLFPVWYNPKGKTAKCPPEFPYLEIKSWQELTERLR